MQSHSAFVNSTSAKVKESKEDTIGFFFSRTTASLALIVYALEHWPLVPLEKQKGKEKEFFACLLLTSSAELFFSRYTYCNILEMKSASNPSMSNLTCRKWKTKRVLLDKS